MHTPLSRPLSASAGGSAVFKNTPQLEWLRTILHARSSRSVGLAEKLVHVPRWHFPQVANLRRWDRTVENSAIASRPTYARNLHKFCDGNRNAAAKDRNVDWWPDKFFLFAGWLCRHFKSSVDHRVSFMSASSRRHMGLCIQTIGSGYYPSPPSARCQICCLSQDQGGAGRQ